MLRVLRVVTFLHLFLLALFVSVCMAETAASPTAHMDYGTGVGKKLGRGLANTAFGWLDIPKGIQEVGDQNNFIAGITWGPIYGTGNAIVRTLAGVYEVATFPIAWPADFEPLVQPEFVLNEEK